jgi:hypothetical protein
MSTVVRIPFAFVAIIWLAVLAILVALEVIWYIDDTVFTAFTPHL